MDLIQSIRDGYGLDLVIEEQRSSEAVRRLSDELGRACEAMSRDLYTKWTHFILELVQNADDNVYSYGVDPQLIIEMRSNTLSVRCNEVGFSEENVRAICKVGSSTKQDSSRYIGKPPSFHLAVQELNNAAGEKGIVFTVANTVRILSGQYTFKFNKKNKPLGMIAPIWIPNRSAEPGWTTIELDLFKNPDAVILHLNDVQPTVLMFLRQLRSIEVKTPGKVRKLTKTERDGITHLIHSDGPHSPLSQQYLVFEYSANTYPREPERQGVAMSDIVLAFPLKASGEPDETDQKFIIQADFLTSTNREDIVTTNEWNRTLCNQIPAAFMHALPRLQERPALTYTWIRFLHQRTNREFFKRAYNGILTELKKKPVLLCRDKLSHRPRDLLVLATNFQMKNRDPIIPTAHLPRKFYLASEYENSRASDEMVLKELGVREMSMDDFLKGLLSMQEDGSLYRQDDDWWDAMCFALLGQQASIREALSTLKIAPLEDGTWITPVAGDLFFNSVSTDVPQDLNFKLVKTLNRRSSHYRLLQDLGVKDLDCLDVANKIMSLHRLPGAEIDVSALPAHAQYLFHNRVELSNCDFDGFKVVTRDGAVVAASSAYTDYHTYTSPLSSYLGSQTPFLHHGYSQLASVQSREERKKWDNWLRDVLQVHTTPGFSEKGLSPEFRQFVLSGDTPRLLEFLKEYASDIMPRLRTYPLALQELSSAPVVTANGVRQPLHSTYIPREALVTADLKDLPFLPIQDPSSPAWDFLRDFNVSFKVDSSHYLKELIRLSELPLGSSIPIEADDIYCRAKDCYKQLEARFHTDNLADTILSAFRERSLIYIPCTRTHPTARWVNLQADIFWDGPPSVTTKIMLKTAYKDLQVFFSQELQIPDAPTDILLQELQHIADLLPDKPVDDESHIRVHNVLKDITDAIGGSQSLARDWFPQLQHFAFIPVESEPGIVKLKELQEGLYLPDHSGELASVFRRHVPLVTIPPQGSANSLASLYTLFNCELFDAVKPLESAVKKALIAEERYPEQRLTDKYRSQARYLPQLLDTPSLAATEPLVQEFLMLLENIWIHTVPDPRVKHIYTLDGNTHTESRFVGVERDDDDLNILVSVQCPPEKQSIYICRELHRFFANHHIPASALLTAFTLPPQILDEFYAAPSTEGLSDSPASSPENSFTTELPTDETESVDYHRFSPEPPHDRTQPSSPIDPEIKSQHVPYLSPPQTPFVAREPSPARQDPVYREQRRFPTPPQFVVSDPDAVSTDTPIPAFNLFPSSLGLFPPSMGPRPPSVDPQPPSIPSNAHAQWTAPSLPPSIPYEPPPMSSFPPFTDNERIPPRMANEALVNQEGVPVTMEETVPMNSAFPMLPTQPSPFSWVPSPEQTREQELAGIMGEKYVYQFLVERLPDFSWKNWSSELRAQMGFPPLGVPSLTDFFYHDVRGLLTRHFFGGQIWNLWAKHPPTYCIEVKATGGTPEEPFHFSASQLARALEMARYLSPDPSAPPPAYIYVLARVSHTLSSPIVQWHPNPWRMLCEGHMLHASDVALCIRDNRIGILIP
ncbi:hypothetical protein EIP86_006439 [Pleurotus ostreatoroseus]|nr:hypothetical protein EIP86_006439 [Pleurotus ostreatoroseus]